MNTQTTIEKMKQMRLSGMSTLYHQSLQENLYSDYTVDQFLALLVDTEWEYRQNRKIQNLIKKARFKLSASPTDIDYTARRNLDKNTFERLLSLGFLRESENIIITGASGVGKSYLAQAIGHAACHQCIKTYYISSVGLSEDVQLAKLDGTYIKLLKKIKKMDLLILDDFGLHSIDDNYRQALMDIIEDRYNRASTIITSQIPVSAWHEMIGEGTMADAILDRLVYSSHRLELKGESIRKKRKLKG